MVPIDVGTKRKPAELVEDFGIRPTSLEDLQRLAPVDKGGVVSYGSQTHPADGTAGCVVTSPRVLRSLGSDGPVVHILATGFARAGRAEMPQAPVPAA